jgi:hypothetical protein
MEEGYNKEGYTREHTSGCRGTDRYKNSIRVGSTGGMDVNGARTTFRVGLVDTEMEGTHGKNSLAIQN